MKRWSRTAGAITIAVTLVACAAGDADPSTTEREPTPSASTVATTEQAQPATPSATSEPTPSAQAEAPSDPLLTVELVDVRTGQTFTLAELAMEGRGPVLLEPMAVWCTSCLAQQREVVTAHERAEFTSVSLDVDLSESPEDLAAYADREGFGWHFAMADPELYRALQDRFGLAVTNPPSTPLIVIETDGSVTPLEFNRGIRSAEQLIAEIGAG